MSIVGAVLSYILYFFLLLLVARLVFEYVQMFARSWRPRGVILVLAEATYTITDPPLKLLRRFIPPLRLGSVAIDLSFIVLFIVVWILIQVVGSVF
ncbi:MAG: YggT family protein [Streptosporangiaceae bacterium]